MSDIPRARQLIEHVLDTENPSPEIRHYLKRVLRLMHRVPFCRRAPVKRKKIDRNLRRRVHHLATTTDMTMHEIANKVGLRSSGRVSDIMHEKR